MNELEATVGDILKALKDGAEQYGPQALDVALALKRVEGIGVLAVGLLCLLGLIPLMWWTWKKIRPPTRTPEIAARIAELEKVGWRGRSNSEDDELAALKYGAINFQNPTGLAYLLAFIPAAVLAGYATPLLNVWNWVAAFRPDLALAHDVLLKLTGQ